jgi:UPF0755 protein
MAINKKYIRIGLIAIAAIFAMSAYIGLKVYRYAFGSDIAKTGIAYIPSDVKSMSLGEIFPDSIFKNPRYAHKMWETYNPEGSVRSGYYVIPQGLSLRKTFNILRAGLQTPVKVVLNPVRTIDRLAGMVSRFIEIDSARLYAKLSDPLTAEHYGFTPETFIGMFLPDTYEFYWNVSIDSFLNKMQRQYELFWTQNRRDKAKSLKMSINEILTLASIVDEESNIADDMRLIAGVYLNRLRIGMPLQADPTVRFSVGDFSLKRILKRHTEIISPYNTYLNIGLPPGPICIPSKVAIDAVLNYEKSDYLYFCASDDFSGRHKFARSLREHNRNAAAYQKALNRAGIR